MTNFPVIYSLLLSCLLCTSVSHTPDSYLDCQLNPREFESSIADKQIQRKGSSCCHIAYYKPLQKKVFYKGLVEGRTGRTALELEIKALHKLKQSNYFPVIVGYFTDFFCTLHVVMEHIRSFDLSLVLNSDFHQLIYPNAAFYISQILYALEYLNSKNLLYIDLKDENILIDSEGLVVLADLGGCGTPEEIQLAGLNKFATPLYAAPELFESSVYLHLRSCASDWWSFGVVCYMILSGSRPFDACDLEELIDEITEKRINYRSIFKDEEAQLLMKLLDRSLIRRYGYHNQLDALKSLPFFSRTNWKDVEDRQLVAPIQFRDEYYVFNK